MKLTTKLIAALAMMSGSAFASSLTLTVAVDTSFNSGGTLLSTGYSVTGGWYDVTLGLDFASVSAGFVPAGNSIAFPYGGNPSFAGYATGDSGFFNANTLGLETKNIFWFVTNDSNNGEFALIEDTGAQFVSETSIPNTNASDLDTSTFANFTLHAVASGSDSTTIGLVQPIPEPSAALLGGLGALGLLRRRRN